MRQSLAHKLMVILRRSEPIPPAAGPSHVADKDPWWESKLLLLIFGAVLTNFLAPRIADNLDAIKWRRQQQVQQARLTIDAMNRFMKDTATLQAAYGRIDAMSQIALTPHPTRARRQEYERAFNKSMSDWYSQTATIAGETMFFEEHGAVRKDFQRYYETSSDALLSYRIAVLNGDSKRLANLRSQYAEEINDHYETLLNESRPELVKEQAKLADKLNRRESPWSIF